MNSREKILTEIRKSQPESSNLPDIDIFKKDSSGLVEKFIAVLASIGGKAYIVKDFEEVQHLVKNYFPEVKRIVTTSEDLKGIDGINLSEDPHLLENIDLAILKTNLGVAENSAVWITEDIMKERVLPFICQYLAVVIIKIIS